MKKQKQFEKWANKILKELQEVYLLQHFDLKPIKFNKNETKAQATCTFNFPYNTIQINYSKDLYEDWEKKDYVDVIGTLIHEMGHPLTDELYSKGYSRFCGKEEIEDAREKLTDHFANIILKLYKFNKE